MLPIFVHGFASGDDAFVHYRWATEFHEALRERGVFYPRWLSSANNGQGSPVMLYCPPLPFFVVEAFNLLVRDTLLALALGCWVGMVGSGLAMYVLARSLLSPWPSLLAALLYIIAPYHIFVLYQRSALSEYWTFVWLPLVLNAIQRIAKGGGWRATVYLAVSYAMLVFSHLVTAFAVTLILPIFILVMTRDTRRLVKVAAGLVLGLGVSGIFITPVLLERDYARIHRAVRLRYTNYFQFEDLINASRVRLFAREQARVYLAEWINVVALCVLLLFVVSVLVIWIRRRSDSKPALGSRTVTATMAITGLSLLLTTRLSLPIWEAIPQLAYMQFPFRWLVISTTGACSLAGIAASILIPKFRLRFLYSALLMGAVLFSLAISTLALARASYDRQQLEQGLSAPEVPEYRTAWWDKELHLQDEFPSIAVSTGDATAQVLDDRGINQHYAVDALAESVLKLRQLYFPGWVARVDGKQTETTPGEDGHIQLTVPPGRHTLTLRFEDTRPRAAGKLISSASLLISVVVFVISSGVFRRKSSNLTDSSDEHQNGAQ